MSEPDAADRPPGPGPRAAATRTAMRWLLLAATLGFIAFYFSRNQDDLALLRQIHLGRAASLVGLYLVYYLAQGRRYQVVLAKCSGRELAFAPWFRLFVLGRFLNTVFPQAGNLYRSVQLKHHHGVSYTSYASGLFSFAWLDTVFNLLVAALAIVWLAPGARIGGLPLSPLLLALALAAIVGPVLLERVLGSFRVPGRWTGWAHEKLVEALRASVVTLRDQGYLAHVFALGLAVFAIACVTFLVAFESLGVPVGVTHVVAFYVLLKLTSHVNLTPGNLGVLELAFGVIGSQLGAGMGESMLVSGLLRVTGFLGLLVFAVPFGGLGLAASGGRADDSGEAD